MTPPGASGFGASSTTTVFFSEGGSTTGSAAFACTHACTSMSWCWCAYCMCSMSWGRMHLHLSPCRQCTLELTHLLKCDVRIKLNSNADDVLVLLSLLSPRPDCPEPLLQDKSGSALSHSYV